MMLVRLIDLVGKGIDGCKIDIRRRNFDGELTYGSYRDEDYIRELKEVVLEPRTESEIERGIGDMDWLRVRWVPDRRKHPTDCGNSGGCDKRSNERWFVMIDVPQPQEKS